MKKLIVLSAVLFAVMTACSSGVTTGNKSLENQDDSLSNALGLLLGMQLSGVEGIEIDNNMVYSAMELVLSASDSELDSLTKHEVPAAQAYFQNYMTDVLPKKVIAESEAFLEKISKEKGVMKTESGLYYKIIEEGDMNVKAFSDKDTVVVNYVGTTPDGKEFDSSFKRNEPAEFALNRVVKGWTEGLQLVGKGGKIMLYIPSELGYGSRGQLGNKALTFDVDVIDVKPAKEVK